MEQNEITAGELASDRLGNIVKIEDGPIFDGQRPAHVQGALWSISHYLDDQRRPWVRIEIDLIGNSGETVVINRKADHPVFVFAPSSS